MPVVLSFISTPSASRASAAVSVGAARERITFLKCVPPSAPLIPLFARTPSSAFIVSRSTPAVDTAPAATSVASPSCATLVFDLWAVLVISSMYLSRSRLSIPRAAMASVTMSDAVARSRPPAAARSSTLGSTSTDFSAL